MTLLPSSKSNRSRAGKSTTFPSRTCKIERTSNGTSTIPALRYTRYDASGSLGVHYMKRWTITDLESVRLIVWLLSLPDNLSQGAVRRYVAENCSDGNGMFRMHSAFLTLVLDLYQGMLPLRTVARPLGTVAGP